MKNIKLEQVILGSMLIDKECSIDCELLIEDDFTNESNKLIFSAIKGIVKANEPVDYMTVHKETGEKVDLMYLLDLTEGIPTTANFKKYIKDLKDMTVKRQLKALMIDINNKDLTGEEAMEIAEQGIFRLRDNSTNESTTKGSEVVLNVFKEIEDIYAGRVEKGVMSGYKGLDNLINGFKPGDYTLLAARPSMGKTALGLNMAEKMVINKKKVLIFSYEMTENQLVTRMLSGLGKVDANKINKRKGLQMNEEDWTRLINAAEALNTDNLKINDDPTLTVAQMQSIARKMKMTDGLDIVIIDYLQKVRPANAKGDRRSQVEQISSDIKNMAKILNVPVIVISSLSRESEKKAGQIPALSDLRDSGQLEYDADIVMFLHRPAYYDATAYEKEAILLIDKHRNGPLGRVDLVWESQYTKFLDVEDQRYY